MAGKRGATSDLNHDNWDQEETPEEAGTFNRAAEDVLKKRVFKTAKRRILKTSEEGSLNVFNPVNLAKFGSKTSQPASQIFGFLSNVQSDVPKTNGMSDKSDKGEADKQKLSTLFSFGNKIDKIEVKTSSPMLTSGNNGTEKSNTPTFSFGGQSKDVKEKESNTMFSFASKPESKDLNSEKTTNNLDNYYAKLKGLNQSVAKWISKHVESNPLINLQPIFKDYERFFEEMENERNICGTTPENEKVGISSQINKKQKESDKPSTGFSFASKYTENKVELPPSAAMFKFNSTTSSNNVSTSESPLKLNFTSSNSSGTGFGSFSFGSIPSAPLNFGDPPVLTPAIAQESRDEQESDELPKVEIKEVEEEGHIYTIRCKLFVKKDGNFNEKGMGSLFLKPVPESDKVQLIVRAHNSLGNVLCNFILSKSIPTQRMGKNNVVVVCIPTPESKPPPVSVLIRVKTAEDADQLLQTLEKHKN